MRKYFFLLLIALSFTAQAADLPGRVFLNSATQSFTHQYDVAISGGKIWHRSRATSSEDSLNWTLLGKTGLPAASSFLGLGGFDSPASVTELSADGDNLIAIGNDEIIYYMKWSTRKWTNTWGQPLSRQLRLPEKIRSWSISHRGPFAGGYSDIDGNFHAISAGVTTLYALSDDGLTISYADPWLPADFSHEICGPLRGRFQARALAASASTLFVINDAGEMYTRLADFDTLGLNPFLSYSYERRIIDLNVEKDVRTLPPEDWKKEPSISPQLGRITQAITILQTGKGNNARELRVEGVNANGVHGFFSKPISGKIWQFTQTDLPLQRPFLTTDSTAADLGPDLDRTVSGHLRVDQLFADPVYLVEIKNFNPLCSKATLVVFLENEKIELPLLTVSSSRQNRKMKGAVLRPAGPVTDATKSNVHRKFMKNVFGNHSFAKIKLSVNEQGAVFIRID